MRNLKSILLILFTLNAFARSGIAEVSNSPALSQALGDLASRSYQFAGLLHYKPSFQAFESDARELSYATQNYRSAAQTAMSSGDQRALATLYGAITSAESGLENKIVPTLRNLYGQPGFDGEVFNEWFMLYQSYYKVYRITYDDSRNTYDVYQKRVLHWEQKFLGRTGVMEDAGLNTSAELLSYGVPANDVLRFMLASDEFYNRCGGNPVSYAKGLYRAVSGQAAPDDFVQKMVDSLAADPSDANRQLLANQLLNRLFPSGNPPF